MPSTTGLPGKVCVLILCVCGTGLTAAGNAHDAAIERGLAWILAHPATCADGGFLDLVDEGLFYLAVERLSAGVPPDAQRERAFAECLSRLSASPEFRRLREAPDGTLIRHYHGLLATHLIETARGPLAGREDLIAAAQRALAHSAREHPTFRLTVALLLQHLGAAPPTGLDALLEAGTINRLARREPRAWPGPSTLHPLDYYALVHEVAALTDFGRLAPSPWLAARRARVGEALQEGARLAMASGQVDLLAEMLLGSHMLGLPATGELRRGIRFLVSRQQADGSWGAQATPRASRVRHAVQTATAALMAYRDSAAQD